MCIYMNIHICDGCTYMWHTYMLYRYMWYTCVTCGYNLLRVCILRYTCIAHVATCVDILTYMYNIYMCMSKCIHMNILQIQRLQIRWIFTASCTSGANIYITIHIIHIHRYKYTRIYMYLHTHIFVNTYMCEYIHPHIK